VAAAEDGEERLRILYVDDDNDIRAITVMALGLDPAMELRSAASGAEALAMLRADPWRPDVLLLDVMMPEMDGMELARALRAMPDLADTPLLFVTARARDADIHAYRAAGASGIIPKPFDPLDLPRTIRDLVA
jgi:two-component system, OmpR family, response regulator